MNIHQRLAKAMEAVTYIQKEKKAGMRYSIVSHDAVTAKVRPALLEAGIVYYPVHTSASQTGNRTEAHMTVRFVNIDEPNDYFDVELKKENPNRWPEVEAMIRGAKNRKQLLEVKSELRKEAETWPQAWRDSLNEIYSVAWDELEFTQ